MPIRIFVTLLAFVSLVSACKSMDTNAPANMTGAAASVTPVATSGTTPAAASTVLAKIDPCKLLSNEEIKAVQGEAPTQSRRADRAGGGFIVAQCYYALPTTSNSVVLNVTTAVEGSGRHPREFWKETFASSEEKDKDRDRKAKERKGEEEESAKPEKVRGVGDDAYWTASRVGGALYVLKKDLSFRISVGGAGDAKSKLNKSKTLAQKVLQRL